MGGWFLVLLLFYALSWLWVGKKPKAGIIIPLFEPPKDVSPAAMVYLTKGNLWGKHLGLAISASIVDMAVKGFLKIQKVAKEFTLIKLKNAADPLSIEEEHYHAALFATTDTFVISPQKMKNQAENDNFKSILEKFSKDVSKTYQDDFSFNNKSLLFGLLLSIAAIVSFWFFNDNDVSILTDYALTIVMDVFILLALLYFIVNRKIHVGLFIGCLVVSVFVYSDARHLWLNLDWQEILVVGFAIGMLVLLGLFIMIAYKVPTIQGRKILDEIEGFKLYLSTAEKDSLKVLNAPEVTPSCI